MDATSASSPAAAPSRESIGRTQFIDEVFPQEMKDVAARRAALDPAAPPAAVLEDFPTAANGLVGLALSGGGMRSASFNLGVLQALHAAGVIERVDYLSTVSGGGWIGACWSALGRTPGAPFPFDPAEAAGQEVLNHVRDRSASLIPPGLLGGSGTAAQLIRGICATLVLLLPVQAALALASSRPVIWMLREQVKRHGKMIAHPEIGWFLVYSRWVALGALAWLGFTILLASAVRPGHRVLRSIDRSFPLVVPVVLLSAWLELQPYAVLRWNTFIRTWRWQAPDGVTPLLLACAVGAALGWPLLRRLLPAARGAVVVLAMLASLAVPYFAYLHFVTWFVRAEIYGDALAQAIVRHPVCYVLPLLIYGLTDVNVFSMHGYFRRQLVRSFVLRPGAGGGVQSADPLRLSELAGAGSTAPVHLINATVNLLASDDRSLRGRAGEVFIFSRRYFGSLRTGYCDTAVYEALVPGMTLATAVAVSASAVSPNMGVMTIRPLVLLMTFLNLRLGYWLPNPARMRQWRGFRSLGLWRGVGARLRCIPRIECYLRELASWMHEAGPWVYLSDGGHLENTGAYELLRRRCRTIVISDAEEDPRLEFGGLVALMRYARLDLRVEIDIDLAPLQPDAPGRSRRHSAVGTIRYPKTDRAPAETGRLLYLKSSVTGDEHQIISQYRATNPDFPHQSTGDQVFDEAQFEAYRSLGEHIAREALTDASEESLWGA